MPDHVHAAVRLHQTVSVSNLAKELKGASSYEIARVQHGASQRLAWQEGYGAFSFREKRTCHARNRWIRDCEARGRDEPTSG
jgi:REP element-mobilizing transposase RayT